MFKKILSIFKKKVNEELLGGKCLKHDLDGGKCLKHDPDMMIKLEVAKMTEPGKGERKVKIRMLYIKCKKCNELLRIAPCGIAHDPEKGIIQKENWEEKHSDLTEQEKEKLLNEIKQEGVFGRIVQ